MWIGQFGDQFGGVTDSLTGGGHINLSGGEIIGGIFNVTVVNDNTISGTGFLNFSVGGQEAHGVWINQGIIDASTPNGTLTIGHTLIENSSILEATHGGLLNFIVAPVHNAAQGVIEATGENSEVIMGFNLASGGDTNAGLIAAVHGGTVLMQDVFGLDNTNGTIEAGHGSTVGLGDAGINGGFVTVLKDGLLKSEPHQQSFAPSTITGAAVTNAGTIGAEGANLTIIGDVTNTGTLDANNATLLIEGAVSGGKATIEGTGEIEFGGASPADVTFAANADGFLKLDEPLAFTGTVSGFTTGDYIDLTNINFAHNPTLSYSSKTHVLTVTDSVSHVTDTITFKGEVGSFSAQDDGSGGTLITDPPSTNMVAVSHSQDSFVFAPNLGKETVTDFNVSHDILAFDHTLFTNATASQVLSQAHDSGAGAVIAVDTHNTVTVTGVTVAQPQSHTSDFHFF